MSAQTSCEEIRKPKHPKFRIEQRNGAFLICERHFRMGCWVYWACSNWGRFETREAAQTALDARVAA